MYFYSFLYISECVLTAVSVIPYEAKDSYKFCFFPLEIIIFARRLGMDMAPYFGSRLNVH